MVERTSFIDGEPCWADLMARDPQAARGFYSAVFGWTFEVGGPEFGEYAMCLVDGRAVAGMMPWHSSMGETASMWSLYLAAASTDQIVEAITKTGGQIMMGPMDVANVGRMAFGTDPTGAAFGIWQAEEHIGFGRTAEPGAFAWAELVTADPSRADHFYQGLFGYEQKQSGEGDFDYATWSLSGEQVLGRMAMPAELREQQVPPHWTIYFAVDDTDAAIGRAAEAGGRVLREPHDSPYGRLAEISDLEGARLHIIDLAEKAA